MTEELRQMRRALKALELEVPASVADDVTAKVNAFLVAWQKHLTRAHGNIACDYPWQVDVSEEVEG
jgi:hypothetical protein